MMKKLLYYIFLICLLLPTCKVPKSTSLSTFEKVKKVMLLEEGADQFLYWEFKNDKSFYGFELGSVPTLLEYRDTLKMVLGNKKFKATLNKESLQNQDQALIDNEEDRDRINSLLVHTGRIAKIREINYLEAQILNYQMKRSPMFSRPTEFHGFILKNERKQLVRVYFAASNTEWAPHPDVLLVEVEKELSNGWKLTGHLHNHFCKEDKDYLGILAPSLPDAQYFKMLKENFQLEVAYITNGFHTVAIESKTFEEFESH